MNKKFYPLTSSTWNKKEIAQMLKVIKSGKFTMGSNVRKFEQKFASFHKKKYCVMVNSGSSANLLMVASLFYTKNSKLKLKKNDVVLNALIRKTQVRLMDANSKINQLANEVSELLSSLKGDSQVDGELSSRITNLRKKISQINDIASD